MLIVFVILTFIIAIATQPPVWTADRNAYERALASFLELNSNFIQQNENGDAAQQSAQNYTIQVSTQSHIAIDIR